MDWLVATAIFTAMAFFWIAIWCLDIFYYNRLLMGAIEAIIELEKKTKASTPKASTPDGINMSISIENEFEKRLRDGQLCRFKGILLFYGIVFLVIVSGAFFSARMYFTSSPG